MSGAIRVDSVVRIPIGGFDARKLASLREAATVRVETRERRGRELVDVVELRDLSALRGGDLVLPRGMARDVQEAMPDAEWFDETARAPYVFVSRLAWRPHQAEIARRLALGVQGLVLAATGAGKTGAAFAIAAKIGQRTLILVPTVALASQWRDEAMRFLGVEAALCTAGKWTDAPIVIATPETALQHTAWLGAFGLLVVDEVQGFATERRAELIAQIPARWRAGLTATLPSDHRGEILRRLIGSVLYRYGVSDGIRSGVLVRPRYVTVETSFSASYDGPEDWQPLLDAVVEDDARNQQIVDLVVQRCQGVTTLVLSSRLRHLEILGVLLAAKGLRVATMSGETSRQDREAILAKARAGELDVLLGSTVADEGIDIPGLGAVVLTMPSRSEGRLMQRIGRAIRNAPGKATPTIYDLVDDVGPLAAQARARAYVFRRAFGGGNGVAA